MDFVYDNPGCHWQPMLKVAQLSAAAEEFSCLDKLQKQLQQMNMNSSASPLKMNIVENEEESKTSMSDFQLAETDLMDCLMRTNILQRI